MRNKCFDLTIGRVHREVTLLICEWVLRDEVSHNHQNFQSKKAWRWVMEYLIREGLREQRQRGWVHQRMNCFKKWCTHPLTKKWCSDNSFIFQFEAKPNTYNMECWHNAQVIQASNLAEIIFFRPVNNSQKHIGVCGTCTSLGPCTALASRFLPF